MQAQRRERGFTLIELIIVVALIGILASLSAPFLMVAKAAGNEASAIGSLRTVTSSEAAYSTTCARGNYASSMAVLVAGGFASADVNLPTKSGFSYAYALGSGAVGLADCYGNPTQTTYYASASPLSPDTGRRGFATNQLGTIWQDVTGAVPAEPFAVTATVSPIGR